MKIYAHRGFSGKYPEGSRTAYIKAAEIGVDGVECDIRLTRDGVPLCFHDATTKRITGKSGRVSRLSLAQMRERYDLVTFEELLKIAIEKKINLLVETKHPVRVGSKVEQMVVDLVNLYRNSIEAAGIKVVIMSFSYFAVRFLRQRYDHVGYVVKKPWRIRYSPVRLLALGIFLFREDSSLEAKLKDYDLFIWTANTAEEIAFARDCGATAVITNFPNIAKEVLAN